MADSGRSGGAGSAPGASSNADEDRSGGGRESGEAAGEGAGSASGPMPRVDFSTLVLSLGTTALCQMGLVADPTTGVRADKDLSAAQQTVDTLEMLREKTLGNLDEAERKLIDSLLYELRMRFVEVGR